MIEQFFKKKSQEEEDLWKEFDRRVETGRSDDVEGAVETSKEIRRREKAPAKKKK